jgi:nitroimidazol reductase NimA-like FMN-containing flavoprotein (pyridoxamine 5'-phosphate oxidase superfamily)
LAQLSFSKPERDFLKNNEICRIATCHDSVPHVVPVAYIFENDTFFIATDYETRKYQNIKHNNKVALVVDVYSSVNNKALCVQGRAEIIEEGQEFGRLYKLFYSRFEWVRQDPWKEGEAPFIKVVPISKTSWGLK